MSDLTTIEEKITKLEKGIASEATDPAMREIFKEKLEKLQSEKASLIEKEQNGEHNKITIVEEFFKIHPFEKAYSLQSDGGYSVVAERLINANGDEITVKVVGESPVVDADDEKKIKQAVGKLLGLEAKITIGETEYTVSYGKPTVTIKGDAVTGEFILKLSDTLKK